MDTRRSRNNEDLKPEDFLQAVVIADSFNVRFMPLTNDKPRTLLPLVNVPLLEYVLEFLSSGGVQRAIVFCCVRADQIKHYLQRSKWMTAPNSGGMEVLTVVSDGCMSVGDALRDLEAKAIIRSDFVLVHGDLVANLKLAPIVDEHRKRRTVTKGAVMTMVYKEAPPGHATRRLEDELVVGVDSRSQQVVGHQRLYSHGTSAKRFVLQREAFDLHRSIQIRHDLLDCHISICAPTVLQLMADNFDYETIDDLVKGILVNEEVLDASVYVHAIHGLEYAARAADPTSYAAVSQDVMSRWVYPFVPDRNMTGLVEDNYMCCRHNVYLHRQVTLERGSTLVENVAVGDGSQVGENAVISRSVIGKRCRIGKNVHIEGSYLLNDVIVEDGCKIVSAILDSNVSVGMNSVITGSLIASWVHLNANSKVEPGAKLVADSKCNIDDMVIQRFGDSDVFEYRTSDSSRRKRWDIWGMPPAEASSSFNVDEECTSSDTDDEDVREMPILNEEKLITDEMVSTLQRATDENISIENVIVEINSIKHAYGVQIKELNGLLVKTVLELPARSMQPAQMTPVHYLPRFKAVTKRFLPLLKNYFRGRESQNDMLVALEEFSASNEIVLNLLPKIIHHLYDEECDILSEEVILEWWKQMENSKRSPTVRSTLDKFIQWLKTAEEEESDSD
jgi:translation initiation factor eIF-2B subunit epsilon